MNHGISDDFVQSRCCYRNIATFESLKVLLNILITFNERLGFLEISHRLLFKSVLTQKRNYLLFIETMEIEKLK